MARDVELDRAIGALLGLAIGDAVGTTLEFKAPGTFTPITDMVGGGPFGLAPGAWTDDTSMALCLAESILDTRGMDLADQLRRYLLWKDDGYLSSNGRCFDIGLTTSTQLERYRRTGEAVDPRPDEESAANGSLMRLAAVPIRWHTDLDATVTHAAASSRTTHAARRPVDACRLMAAIVAALIQGQTFDEVTSPAFWQWSELHPGVAAIAAGGWTRKQPPQIRGTGFCIDALEAALWSVSGADDFRSAVLRAANLGATPTRPRPSPGRSPAPDGVPRPYRRRGGRRSWPRIGSSRWLGACTPPAVVRPSRRAGPMTRSCTPGGSSPDACSPVSTPATSIRSELETRSTCSSMPACAPSST